MLFAVPAAQVPKQSNRNLVAYDKACSSVPAVIPTASNPTGKVQSGSNTNTNQQGQQGQQNQQGQQGTIKTGQKLAVRDTCGGAPTGSNQNQAPLSQPQNINSAADCLARCKANPSCKSFEFGTENNAKVCRLFNVAAASVPPPTNGQSFQVYDIQCSI